MRRRATAAEKFFWQRVCRKQILGLRFQRQFPVEQAVAAAYGAYFVLDFCCLAIKLAVELDGDVHLKQQNRDRRRDAMLIGLGYSVVRFTNEQVLKDWDRCRHALVLRILEIQVSPPQ